MSRTLRSDGSRSKRFQVLPHEATSVQNPGDLDHSPSHISKKKKTRHKSSKHRHHTHKAQTEATDFLKLDGVSRVILSDEVQRLLKCVVGENVTAEKPWTHIKKFYISEQVESEEVPPDYQTFLPHKQEIADFPNDALFVGYIPDESRDYDEFYICLTVDAEEEVQKLVKELEEKQTARLENTINKTIGVWQPLGSAREVEENWIINSRGLLMVEFEAKYPIISEKVQFRNRLVSDVRDGYAELLCSSKFKAEILHKRRIHNATQVAPCITESFAQTFCAYPVNAWTQYEYHVEFISHLPKEWIANFRYFIDSNIDNLDDAFAVNANINFYTNDYLDLVDKQLPVLPENVYKEYQSFDDIKRCMDKMISAMSWHPLWTGIIAIAYVDVSPRWYNVEKSADNPIGTIVHGYNPVLIWSFNDSLNPKLILETHAEVHCLAFCPHDPNLLVGGCVNGQIVLWDIKNKLTKVETEEILTPAQQAYRTRLFGEMAWMKNTRDYSIIQPTAFSQLLFTHLNNVTAIEWLHPMYRIARTGRVELVPEDEVPSLQFITSGSDGTIKFWDLKQKVISTGDYRPERKSRRLGKRPSALTMDSSPYRFLNRRMIPHFELDIVLPDIGKSCPIASISLQTSIINYVEINPNKKKILSFTDRVIFEPIYEYLEYPVFPRITFGTYTGHFAAVTWEGYEYISGDIFSKEEAKFSIYAKYHDGPVLTCMRHPLLDDVHLSVGGKIFCIWSDKLKGKPLLWRRSRNRYTHGNWEQGSASCFCFTTSNGSREYWNLDSKSDGPYAENMYSGKPLLQSEVHPLPLPNEQKVVGIADDRGTLRLIQYNTPKFEADEDLAVFIKFLHNNAQRANDFEEWQDNWTKKHAGWIKQQQENELREQVKLREEELARQAYEEELQAKMAIEEARAEAAKLHPPPGMYEEWAMDRWIIKEQERMGNELLSNKRLDKDTLIKQQAPLKRLEVEAAKTAQKIKTRLAKVDEIFNDTIAMLFPNIVEKPIAEVFDKIIYSDEEKATIQENFVSAFYNIEEESLEVIKDKPFLYELVWQKTLEVAKLRKMKDEFRYIGRHSERHQNEQLMREADTDILYMSKKQKEHAQRVEEEEENEENEENNLSPELQSLL